MTYLIYKGKLIYKDRLNKNVIRSAIQFVLNNEINCYIFTNNYFEINDLLYLELNENYLKYIDYFVIKSLIDITQDNFKSFNLFIYHELHDERLLLFKTDDFDRVEKDDNLYVSIFYSRFGNILTEHDVYKLKSTNTAFKECDFDIFCRYYGFYKWKYLKKFIQQYIASETMVEIYFKDFEDPITEIFEET